MKTFRKTRKEVTETKILLKKGKKGELNTHYKINDEFVVGTIYVPNEIADKHPDVKEFEIEIPFEVPVEAPEDE